MKNIREFTFTFGWMPPVSCDPVKIVAVSRIGAIGLSSEIGIAKTIAQVSRNLATLRAATVIPVNARDAGVRLPLGPVN